MKRYQEGGEAEGISGTAGKEGINKKPRTTDDMTFGQAFRAARKEGKGTFMWRGQKYTTETAEEKKAKKEQEEKVKRDSEAASRQSTRNDAAMMMGSERRKAERAEKAEKPATGRSVPFESSSGTKSRRRFGRAATKSELLMPGDSRGFNKGGKIDGCAKRGHTRGKIV